MTDADLLLSGGYVLPQQTPGQVITDGAVAIRNDRIVAVGPAETLAKDVRPKRTIDCRGRAVMPGLVDCHVHTCQQLARGLADEVAVGPWLDRIVGFEAAMTEEDVVASVRLACVEMIKSGTTGFIEACANPHYIDAVAEVFGASGLRCALTRSTMSKKETAWEAPDEFLMSEEENVVATRKMIQRWNGSANGRVSAWTGWRHLQDLSDKLLTSLTRLIDEFGVGLHAHLSTRQYGEIEQLDRLGLLNSRMVFAHGIRYTARELELIKRYDVKIDHNPGASMHGAYGASAVGRFPEMLKMGIRVCLGCDAAANNNALDMFREMRNAAGIHKDARMDAGVISATDALQMATTNGAIACYWQDVGKLAAGHKADVIVINLTQPHLVPVNDVVSNLVYCATGQDVEMTIVDGRILMEDRRLVNTFAEDSVIKAAIGSAENVKKRVAEKKKF
jgi:cytosine/adenosine deaminase-related metal-dependent hydrolase